MSRHLTCGYYQHYEFNRKYSKNIVRTFASGNVMLLPRQNCVGAVAVAFLNPKQPSRFLTPLTMRYYNSTFSVIGILLNLPANDITVGKNCFKSKFNF